MIELFERALAKPAPTGATPTKRIARLNTLPNDEQDAIAPSILNLIFLYTTVFISVRLLNTLSTTDSSSQIGDRCN
jgi:hypothetical protein